jgi:hypothetical protein
MALKNLKGKIPDALSAGTIVYECRDKLGAVSVKNEDVIAVARGLSILVPDLVGVEGDKIVVNASPERVAAAVETQLEQLHQADNSYGIGPLMTESFGCDLHAGLSGLELGDDLPRPWRRDFGSEAPTQR